MKNLFKKITLSLVFLLWMVNGYAQLYPVQLTPIFNSPYSVKIGDYSNSMDTKMQLLINPTDISISQRQVRLKLYIQGNGLNIQSTDFIQGQKPIFINGGELQTLTNTDIEALFRLENLQGITAAQYANPLPEGMYNYCFEMYDYVTNQKISQKSCTSLYLILNDPPLLNTPQRNEQIAANDFPNILFTWTPRQVNATNVSYKLELKQLFDPTLDPQIGFEMAPILYEETLFSTALVYNLSMPILIPGMKYAWRVRAISTSGLSENSIFKNNGYSEIYSFKYTAPCMAPTFVLSEAQGPKSVKISWQGIPEHTRYQVQYKKKDVRNAQWFSVYSLNTQSLLTDLEPGVTYEFRVGASCVPASDGVQSFSYSGINTFTMPTQTNGVPAYNCGIIPTIDIKNQKPLTNLIQSETFKAGDFPVTVLDLEEQHSPYSGRGYIIVPYLADTKIAVEFKNIIINTDYQLISGVVETSYNPDWKNVADINEIANDVKGLINDITDLFTRADELEKQKATGTISEEGYNKIWKEIYIGLERADKQYKELVNTQNLPADLKKKIDSLDPIFVELASNSYTTSGNQNIDNLDKTNQVFQEVNKFIGNNCTDLDNGKIVLDNLEDYKIYPTPSGDVIFLKNVTNLDMESIYPNENYPDLKVPKGALVAFTTAESSYKARYKKENNKWSFIGYYTPEGREYFDTDSDRLREEFKNKIEKEGYEKASIALVLIEGSSQGLLRSALTSLGLGETVITGATFVRGSGVIILAYFLLNLFSNPATVNFHHGEVLDLPTSEPITIGGEVDNYKKDIPLDLPIAIPHAIPKEDISGSCKVYVIWKVSTTGDISIAKYGMTCTDDYDENCNMRPEKQCIKFEKENNLEKNKFYYNWVITGITKDMCHIVEKSLTAEYVITHGGLMPSHHYLPCFVRDKHWDEDLEGKPVASERTTRALKWIKDMITQYGIK